VAGVFHAPNTNRYRHPLAGDEDAFSAWAADAIEQQIVMEGADTIACVYLEPVQNAGGCFPPPAGYFERVRQICDRYGVLLVSDEVICAFGRLGHLFGCDRYGYVPDMITTAKAMTSGYSPLGAVIARDFLVEPFLAEGASFVHGLTFGGHPVSCAVAMANLDLFEAEDLCGHVRRHETDFEKRLQGLRDLPIVGDVRGAGYFWAIELVKQQAGAQRFAPNEIAPLLRGFLGPRIYEAGLIARTDDRGDPIVQLAPPLIAGINELDEIEAILRRTLGEASAKFCD
jgi:adenosylmethionine-8-amino-7-oxononanoate aminotransferase